MNLKLAKQMNRDIVNYDYKPHERDLARMRLRILRKIKKRMKLETFKENIKNE